MRLFLVFFLATKGKICQDELVVSFLCEAVTAWDLKVFATTIWLILNLILLSSQQSWQICNSPRQVIWYFRNSDKSISWVKAVKLSSIFYFKINWSKKFWIIQLKSEVKSVMIHTLYQSFFWRQLQKLNESNDTERISRVQLNRKKTSFKVCDWNGFLTTCSVPLLTFLYESRESKHV